MRNDLIVLEEDPEYGPAMAGLTDLQKKFVIATLATGGQNDAEAARIAGYSVDRAKQAGWTNMHNPRVIEALQEEAKRRIDGGALLAASALVAIVKDPTHKEHFKATVELLNRSGLQFIQKHEVIHTDNRTAAELVDYIKRTAPRLLGVSQEIVDAQYTEVEDDDLSDIL